MEPLRPEAGPWWRWGEGVPASGCQSWGSGVETRGGRLCTRPGTPTLISEDF